MTIGVENGGESGHSPHRTKPYVKWTLGWEDGLQPWLIVEVISYSQYWSLKAEPTF
jgi:hypothetical protein